MASALNRFARRFGSDEGIANTEENDHVRSSPSLSPSYYVGVRGSNSGNGRSSPLLGGPAPPITRGRSASRLGEILSSMDKMNSQSPVFSQCVAREQQRELRLQLERHRVRATQTLTLSSPPLQQSSFRPINPEAETNAAGICANFPPDHGSHEFESNEEFFRVCKYCGIISGVSQNAYQTDYRETHSTDSSMARADAPSTRRDEQQEDRTITTPRRTGSAPATTREFRQSMGYAQEITDRDSAEAAKTNVEELMDSSQRVQLQSLKKETKRLISMISPMERNISEAIVATTDNVYNAYLMHSKYCHKQCTVNLRHKATRVIANKCVVHTVEEASRLGLSGVSAQSITLIQDRINNHESFRQYNHSTQHNGTKLIVKKLSSMDVTIPCVCDAPPTETKVSSPVLCSPVAFQHQRHDVPALTIQVRDEIAALSAQYKYAAHVRDAARTALNDRAFSNQIRENAVVSQTDIGATGIAYIILRAVETARSAPGEPLALPTESARPLPAGVEKIDVDMAIQLMMTALPDGAKASVSAEDELYDDFE